MNRKISVVVLFLIVCILTVFTTISVSAGTFIIADDWKLEIPSVTNTTEYYIEEYLGNDINVVIPKYCDDRSIVKINSNAITGVVETCVIPDTILEISSNAFLGCETLKSMTIPATVQTMGGSVFANCTAMKSFVVEDYTSSNYIPASCCSGNTSLEEVYIGYGIESIYNYAFKNCGSLNKITISPTVTSIAKKAFDGCDTLVIYCYEGSYALEFAIANNIEYVNLGEYVVPSTPAESESSSADSTEPSSSEAVTSGTTATEPSESTQATSTSTEATQSTATEPTEPSQSTGATDATESKSTDATEPSQTATASVATSASSSAEITTSTAQKESYYIGDADLDGRITIKDATKIQKHVAKLLTLDEIPLALADADNDAKVSVKDATQIQKFIAGFKGIEFVGTEVLI